MGASVKTLSKMTPQDVLAVLQEIAQKANDTNACARMLADAWEDDENEEKLPFHQDLLLALFEEFSEIEVEAKGRIEQINDFLQRRSSYGFLGYELSRRSYRMLPFTMGDANECSQEYERRRGELKDVYANKEDYLAMCKEVHDETQRERKEIEDKIVEKKVREGLENDADYRDRFYRYIAIPREFGARGDYRLGVFELCREDDYEYLYGFDGGALKKNGDMKDACPLVHPKTLDSVENETLASLAADHRAMKKSAITDSLIEAALGILPYSYEKSAALESLHQNPTHAHTVYLQALKKRPGTKKPYAKTTADIFAEIKALRARTAASVEEVYSKESSRAKKEATYNSLQPKMTVAFWILFAIDVILLIGAFVLAYQTGSVYPTPVYLIGAALSGIALYLCWRYVEIYWWWTDRDWKIGIMIALGVLIVIWLAMAVAPEKLLESVPQA